MATKYISVDGYVLTKREMVGIPKNREGLTELDISQIQKLKVGESFTHSFSGVTTTGIKKGDYDLKISNTFMGAGVENASGVKSSLAQLTIRKCVNVACENGEWHSHLENVWVICPFCNP